eukprot:GHVS01061096.1.p5 GENE.GHVS01061096.1~~GHVS01061096.1.p5  ORF type:complete len:110 (-),score=35.04 GHVS01061096.1:1258-1587(-)
MKKDSSPSTLPPSLTMFFQLRVLSLLPFLVRIIFVFLSLPAHPAAFSSSPPPTPLGPPRPPVGSSSSPLSSYGPLLLVPQSTMAAGGAIEFLSSSTLSPDLSIHKFGSS